MREIIHLIGSQVSTLLSLFLVLLPRPIRWAASIFVPQFLIYKMELIEYLPYTMGQVSFGKALIPSVLHSGPVLVNICDYSCRGDKDCVCFAHHHTFRVSVPPSLCRVPGKVLFWGGLCLCDQWKLQKVREPAPFWWPIARDSMKETTIG